MNGRLAGQRCLVAGAGSGIGRAVTAAYLAEGATVIAIEVSPAHADQLVRDGHPHLHVEVGDATDPDVLDRAVACAMADEGRDGQTGESGAGPGLDNLTCCVGVFDYYASLRELTAAQLAAAAEELYRINVHGTLQAVRAAIPALRRRRGSITLTLSESAFHPIGGGVLYASSKWALRGAVAHLAVDLAPQIRVNGVAPGGTSGTRFGGLTALGHTQTADQVSGRDERIAAATLLGTTATPEQHAGAYVYLADRRAGAMTTAAIINTDGGHRP